MGRGGSIAIIAGFIAIMAAIPNGVSPTRAQESTPAVESTEVEIASGVTFALLPASEDPPTLYRLRIAPGATLLFADDPAISLVYVESGALALDMDTAVRDARRNRSAGGDEDDTALAVRQGDYFVVPPLVAGEMRNEGEEPASIVVAAITPGMFPAAAAGTPAAE